MAKSKQSTALSKVNTLENALKQANVVDMRLFFKYYGNSGDYWMAGMVLCLDNLTADQKIRLAQKIIKNQEAMEFFYTRLYARGQI